MWGRCPQGMACHVEPLQPQNPRIQRCDERPIADQLSLTVPCSNSQIRLVSESSIGDSR